MIDLATGTATGRVPRDEVALGHGAGLGTLLRGANELRRVIHPHVYLDTCRLGRVALHRVATHEEHLRERVGVIAQRLRDRGPVLLGASRNHHDGVALGH